MAPEAVVWVILPVAGSMWAIFTLPTLPALTTPIDAMIVGRRVSRWPRRVDVWCWCIDVGDLGETGAIEVDGVEL